MILQLYCVRDRATDMFGTPMFLVSTGQAIRSFADEVNRPGEKDNVNQIYTHPADFDLYHLGQWDSSTGVFDTHIPKMVAVGKDLVIKNGG